MATAYQNAVTAALTAAGRLAGVSVTYTTGAGSVTLSESVIRGNTDWDLETENGLAERWESTDWIVPVAGLVIAAASVTPAKGDTIAQTINGTTSTYTVCSPSGLPVYQYLDRGTRTRYRVHSKLTATA